MKILFIADRIDVKYDVNINLIMKILPYFEEDGIKSFFLTHTTKKNDVSDFCFYHGLDENVRNLYFATENLSILNKIFKLIAHPILSFFGIFKVLNIDLIAFKYKKHIELIVKKYDIDVVISLSAPFYTAKALASANINAKKIVYMFDPYADHYIFKNSRTLKQERKVHCNVDAMIVPKLLYKGFLKKYKENIYYLEFPNLVINEREESPFNEKYINVVYVGSLYVNIRSPEFLYMLFKKVNNKNIKITIVGKVYGYFSYEFHKQYDEFVKENVIFTGQVEKKETERYLLNADILINIGNTIENMLPSKIFEIIATGKPVINLTQTESCNTLEYFSLYKNCLSINTKNNISKETIELVNSFIENRVSIDVNQVKKQFYFATPEYVAKELKKIISSTMG